MEFFEFLRSIFDLGLHCVSHLLLVQPLDSMFELLDSVLGLFDLDIVSVFNNFSLGVNRRNVLEGVNVVFSGLVDLLDDHCFLSSEHLDQALMAHLVSLVLLAIALFLLESDDLLAGLLADLDDRRDLHQVLLLLLHLSFEVVGSFGSDAFLFDQDESLLLSDSLEALFSFDSSSPSRFLFQVSDNSELLFSLSSEFLLDFLLLLDESDVSVHHLDLSLDGDQILDNESAESLFEGFRASSLARNTSDLEVASFGFALSLLFLESGFHLLRNKES